MMFRRVNTCSLHERPLLKPACSSRRVRSTASCSLFSSTLLKTLPGVESNVIPRQLLQSLRLPFFGSLIITPFFQSAGTSESCHIMLNSSTNCSATVSLPCLSISADISSTPGVTLVDHITIVLNQPFLLPLLVFSRGYAKLYLH